MMVKTKIRKTTLFFVISFSISIIVNILAPVIVNAEENSNITNNVYEVDSEMKIIEEEEDFWDYTITTYTDSEGNVSVFDSRENYVVENGEEIGFSIVETEETDLIENFNQAKVSLPAWQRIRRNTYTLEFIKSIDDLAISTILGAIKPWMGAATGIAAIIKANYAKPDLRSSKVFYVRKDQYGKTNQYNRVETHTYSLDTKYRKIAKTDKFSHGELKTFLGY